MLFIKVQQEVSILTFEINEYLIIFFVVKTDETLL